MGSLWTSNFDSFWMSFVYCLCRLCIHMFPEGGGHVFYMLRVHFSVALFTSFYASPVIICGWDKQMKSLENDLEQHGTVRNGLDYNSYVWRNAERSADIYKVAQTLDTKTKVSSCSVDFADMSSFSQTVCKMINKDCWADSSADVHKPHSHIHFLLQSSALHNKPGNL